MVLEHTGASVLCVPGHSCSGHKIFKQG